MSQLELRCSGLPLAFRCAGSVRRGVVPINETSEPADLGTAAHEGLATLVQTGKVDYEAVPALAKKHGVNEEELRVLLALGAQLWEQVKASFPNPMVEVELSHTLGPVKLTGHADIYALSGETVFVPDWKTGRVDSDYSEQLKGYAALALLEDPALKSATAGVLWVRDCSYEYYTMDRAGLYTWLQRIEDEIVQWDGTFRPGKHCEYCSRAHECPAANAMVRSAVAAITDQDVADAEVVRAMKPEQVIRLLGQADLARSQAERVRAAIRKRVEESGDITADGKVLTLVTEERRKLNTWAAFPVLEAAGLDQKELAEVIDISVTRTEKIIATKAGKGKGAAAVRALKAALEDANAVENDTVTKLVTKRA